MCNYLHISLIIIQDLLSDKDTEKTCDIQRCTRNTHTENNWQIQLKRHHGFRQKNDDCELFMDTTVPTATEKQQNKITI